jgi:hypothetical protein
VLLAVPGCAGEPPPRRRRKRRRGSKEGTNPGPPDRTRSEARTRNGEGLSCCAGPPKGTLRERRCACSAARKRPCPRSGRRGRRVQVCHPDHSRKSLTCGNAVSCARCSIPQRSPQRPRGNKWNAGATATGRRTPSRPARRSRPRGTAGSLQGTVILRQQRRGLSGRDFRQPGITDDPKSQARPARDHRRPPPRR